MAVQQLYIQWYQKDIQNMQMNLKNVNITGLITSIFNLVEGMGFILNRDGRIMEINELVPRRLEKSRDRILGSKIQDVLFVESREMQKAYQEVAVQGGDPVIIQIREKERSYEVQIVPVFGTDDQSTLFIYQVNDVTQKTKDHDLLYRYKEMISSVNNPIVFLDDALKIRSYNDAFLMLYKIPKENVIGTPMQDILGTYNFGKIKECIESCFRGQDIFMNDWFDFADGIRRYMQIDFHPLVMNEKTVSGVIMSQNDISDRKVIEEKLEELNRTDSLTGIYNRKMLEERLSIESERFRRYNNLLSVVLFDIDHFKKVNDTFGHDVGDMVLIQLTRLIGKNIREIDLLCRWGGEEFIILLPHTSLKPAISLAEKLRKVVENHRFPKVKKLTCSFGVTNYRSRDKQSTFFKRVDNALYDAKKGGRNRVVFR